MSIFGHIRFLRVEETRLPYGERERESSSDSIRFLIIYFLVMENLTDFRLNETRFKEKKRKKIDGFENLFFRKEDSLCNFIE